MKKTKQRAKRTPRHKEELPPYTPTQFLTQLAPHIIADIRPPLDLKKFTANSDVVGAYVEAGVRGFVRTYLAPIRVSTGAVIDEQQSPGSKKIPQLDMIAWIPNPAPSVFVAGEFALVPRSNCLGILEVKASAYSNKALKQLEQRTTPQFVGPLTAEMPNNGCEGPVLAVSKFFGMGVVSVLQADQRHYLKRLNKLRDEGRVVTLFEEIGEKLEPRREDIYRLVNFLSVLRLRAACRDGHLSIILKHIQGT